MKTRREQSMNNIVTHTRVLYNCTQFTLMYTQMVYLYCTNPYAYFFTAHILWSIDKPPSGDNLKTVVVTNNGTLGTNQQTDNTRYKRLTIWFQLEIRYAIIFTINTMRVIRVITYSYHKRDIYFRCHHEH